MSLFVTCPNSTSKKRNSLVEKKPRPFSAVATHCLISYPHYWSFFILTIGIFSINKHLNPQRVTWVQWGLGECTGEKRVVVTSKTHNDLRGIFPMREACRHHASTLRPPKNMGIKSADFGCSVTSNGCALHPGHRGSNLG